ncbi:MAG: ParB/RepB/Spo0J family partition protein [Rhodospirillales bacterium]
MNTPAKKRNLGLGRGLSALLGDEMDDLNGGNGASAGPQQVLIGDLAPSRFQPRRDMGAEALDDLANSIADKGILQPILVRPKPGAPGEYEIIAGERRFRAAQKAGLHQVPVVVREMDDRDAMEVALVENLQRQDLNPIEEAEGFQRLADEFGHTQEELSRAVGKSRSHVANTLRLLGLPAGVKVMLSDGRLTAGHARALVNQANAEAMARDIVERGLNVRQTEQLAKGNPGPGRPKGSTARSKDTDTLAIERDLGQLLGLKVDIQHKGEGKGGSLTIHYGDLDQLDDVLARLSG